MTKSPLSQRTASGCPIKTASKGSRGQERFAWGASELMPKPESVKRSE